MLTLAIGRLTDIAPSVPASKPKVFLPLGKVLVFRLEHDIRESKRDDLSLLVPLAELGSQGLADELGE